MGLWGLFWAFLLYYGPLSRITRFGGACWVARTEPVEPTARSVKDRPHRATPGSAKLIHRWLGQQSQRWLGQQSQWAFTG